MTFLEYTMKNGKSYKPALRPERIAPGQVGECFDVCIMRALKHMDLKYVEGLAEDPLQPGRFMLHAWLTDGVHAFDPTWRAFFFAHEVTLPIRYFGFEMNTPDVAHFFRATGYSGVIANKEKLPGLAKKILPKDFPADEIEPIHHIQ